MNAETFAEGAVSKQPSKALRWLKRRTLAEVLASVLLASSIVVLVAQPADASTECNTGNAPTVNSASNPVFYISESKGYTANYIGYKISTQYPIADLWVELTDFTGGNVNLAVEQNGIQKKGSLSVSDTAVAYFLAEGSATSSPQSHTIKLYDGNPADTSTMMLCSMKSNILRVEDTITATTNKVFSIELEPSQPAEVGDIITLTVKGNTGKIGEGPEWNKGVISLTPVVDANFPANAWRLINTKLEDVTNARTFNNQLSLTGQEGQTFDYVATYTFLAISETQSSQEIIPAAYIASGKQVKHTGQLPDILPTLPPIISLELPMLPDMNHTTPFDTSVSFIPTPDNDVELDLDSICIVNPSTTTCDKNVTIDNEGEWNVQSDGIIEFDPDWGFSGSSTKLIYKAKDNYGQEGAGSIVVIVLPPVPPVMESTHLKTSYNTPVMETIGMTFGDGGTGVLCIKYELECVDLVYIEGEGTWSVDYNGLLKFIPNQFFAGDSTPITLVFTDGLLLTATNTAYATVGMPLPPIAFPKDGHGVINNSLTIKPTVTGESVNWSSLCMVDPADSVCKTSLTNNGLILIDSVGNVTFSPNTNYVGVSDYMEYHIFDQWGQMAVSTIRFHILPENVIDIEDDDNDNDNNNDNGQNDDDNTTDDENRDSTEDILALGPTDDADDIGVVTVLPTRPNIPTRDYFDIVREPTQEDSVISTEETPLDPIRIAGIVALLGSMLWLLLLFLFRKRLFIAFSDEHQAWVIGKLRRGDRDINNLNHNGWRMIAVWKHIPNREIERQIRRVVGEWRDANMPIALTQWQLPHYWQESVSLQRVPNAHMLSIIQSINNEVNDLPINDYNYKRILSEQVELKEEKMVQLNE